MRSGYCILVIHSFTTIKSRPQDSWFWIHFELQIDRYLAPFWAPFGILFIYFGEPKTDPFRGRFLLRTQGNQMVLALLGVPKRRHLGSKMSIFRNHFWWHLGVLLGPLLRDGGLLGLMNFVCFILSQQLFFQFNSGPCPRVGKNAGRNPSDFGVFILSRQILS